MWNDEVIELTLIEIVENASKAKQLWVFDQTTI